MRRAPVDRQLRQVVRSVESEAESRRRLDARNNLTTDSDEVVLMGVDRRSRSRVDPQLGVDIGDMPRHGVRADEESITDIAVGVTSRDSRSTSSSRASSRARWTVDVAKAAMLRASYGRQVPSRSPPPATAIDRCPRPWRSYLSPAPLVARS